MAYERLSSTTVDVKPLLECAIEELLTKISRRLSIKQSLSNPWGIKVNSKIHFSIFVPSWKAIRDYSSEFGREIKVDRNRKTKSLTLIEIKFTHFGALNLHLSKAYGGSAKSFLKKSSNHCELSVIASEDHPVVFTFNCKKNNLTFSCKYQVKNQYGNIVSLL